MDPDGFRDSSIPSDREVAEALKRTERDTESLRPDITSPYTGSAPSGQTVEEVLKLVEESSGMPEKGSVSAINDYKFTGNWDEQRSYYIKAVEDVQNLLSYTDVTFQNVVIFVKFWDTRIKNLDTNSQKIFLTQEISKLTDEIYKYKVDEIKQGSLDYSILKAFHKKLHLLRDYYGI